MSLFFICRVFHRGDKLKRILSKVGDQKKYITRELVVVNGATQCTF